MHLTPGWQQVMVSDKAGGLRVPRYVYSKNKMPKSLVTISMHPLKHRVILFPPEGNLEICTLWKDHHQSSSISLYWVVLDTVTSLYAPVLTFLTTSDIKVMSSADIMKKLVCRSGPPDSHWLCSHKYQLYVGHIKILRQTIERWDTHSPCHFFFNQDLFKCYNKMSKLSVGEIVF